MRSSFTIFLLGLVLGSTMGIGGIWTQVVKPAYEQINNLEQEHGVMKGALAEAGETLREVAEELRSESMDSDEGSAPTPIPTGSIFPRNGGSGVVPSGVSPTTRESTQPSDSSTRSKPRALASRLESLASKLDEVQKAEK